jgi:hypothetical protein
MCDRAIGDRLIADPGSMIDVIRRIRCVDHGSPIDPLLKSSIDDPEIMQAF